MADIVVTGDQFIFNGKTYRCTVGKTGFSADKKEGDGATPIGIFPLRECWYREDRLGKPDTKLPLKIIHENDGWCDDPKSPDYNKPILEPSPSGRGQGEGPYHYTRPELINRSRELRKDSTSPEQKLWSLLRNRQMNGHKFRRQHPIAPYVADFCCDELKLIIEIDGDTHATDEGMARDAIRTEFLQNLGYKIVRFTNHEIVGNIEGVYQALTLTLSQRERGLSGFSFERLWRDDHAYDLIVPIGYNDAPVVPGRGSAIFLHVNHDDNRPTAGCVALAKNDLLALLPRLQTDTLIDIKGNP